MVALELYSMCQLFHCLPSTGGLGQQNHITMRAMATAAEAQVERDKIERRIKAGAAKHP